MNALWLTLSSILSHVPGLAAGLTAYLFRRLPGAIAGSINGRELARVVAATIGATGANTTVVAVLLAIQSDPAIFRGSVATAIGTALVSGLVFALQRFHQGERVPVMVEGLYSATALREIERTLATDAQHVITLEDRGGIVCCGGKCNESCPTPEACRPEEPVAVRGTLGLERQRSVNQLLYSGLITLNEARASLGFAPLSPEDCADLKASRKPSDF